MKVVAAIDSLKGSLSSLEAGNAAREGILRVFSDAEVIVKPIADGGEGTTEALVDGLGGELVTVKVTGPYHEPVNAVYGYQPADQTAFMEMASASGITISPRREPLEATSYGVGEMIRDAIAKGCRHFIIGIGGSATNDCGIGMLTALGFEFTDANGVKCGISGKDLAAVAHVSTAHALPELAACKFEVACDVTNPLCGTNGATYIYGPQKGVVTDELRDRLDADCGHFADVSNAALGTDFKETPGAGAAGGLGFALLSYLKADLKPGIELVLGALNLDACMVGADYAVTGEGRLDNQSVMGKAPVGVANLAKKHGAVCVALAGSIKKGAEVCNQHGIDAFFPILPRILTLDEAMEHDVAWENMSNTAEQVFRLIAAAEKRG